MNLLNVFYQRSGDWFIALFEHLQISLLALLVAIVIAIPLGFLLSDHKKIKEFSLQSAGIMSPKRFNSLFLLTIIKILRRLKKPFSLQFVKSAY